jgi:hypothetical protein
LAIRKAEIVMRELPRCDTNEDLLDLVKQSGSDYETIAKTIYGLEIVCVRKGREKKPAIVITAGAHAGEPAGVLTALSLINTLDTEHAVYIVPLRDPFAWGGFARCLGFALGEEVVIQSHEDAERLLVERGVVVHREEEDSLIISFIGDLVFASMRPIPPDRAGTIVGPRSIERRLNRAMREKPELVSVLAGKRACWPSNCTGVEGVGDFDRAFSAFVTSQGLVADLNRHFTFAYPPVEVACVRDLVDRVKPGLILDLHEGQGSKFYLFASPYQEGDKRAEIAAAILGAVVEQGRDLYRLEELARRLTPEVAQQLKEPMPGLIVGPVHNLQQGASFRVYCQRYGAAYGFEPGRWKPLAERVEEELAGALAGVSEFEKLHQA